MMRSVIRKGIGKEAQTEVTAASERARIHYEQKNLHQKILRPYRQKRLAESQDQMFKLCVSTLTYSYKVTFDFFFLQNSNQITTTIPEDS